MPALSRIDRLLVEAKSKFAMKWHKKGGLYYATLTEKEAKGVVRFLGLKEDKRIAYTTFENSEPKTSLDYIKVVHEGYGTDRVTVFYDAFTFSDAARLSIEEGVAQSHLVPSFSQEEAKFKWPEGWSRIPKSEGLAYKMFVGRKQAEAIIELIGGGMRKVSDPDPKKDLWSFKDVIWVDKTYSRSVVSIVSAGQPDHRLEEYTYWIAQAIAEKKPVPVFSQEEKKLKPIAVRSGAFHKWLGKSEHEPITAKDIELGLASKDGNIRRMAKAAQAKRNIGKKK